MSITEFDGGIFESDTPGSVTIDTSTGGQIDSPDAD